jgi:hypothetical protein
MIARIAAALLLVAACSKEPQTQVGPNGPGTMSGSSMEPGTSGSGTTGGTAGSGTTPTTDERPKLGEPCAAGDVCGEGTCVKYFGIAGPRGPEFKSCEIRCDAQTRCESGRQCVTVADGPGQVCR